MKNTSEHPEETRIFEVIEEMRASMGDSFSLALIISRRGNRRFI